jgi:isoleucyl-tRNA synthetase
LQLTLEDGSEVALDPDEVLVRTEARAGYGVAGEGGLVVALDTEITPELEQEGLAREVIRRIQELRKEADYELTDHIVVEYNAEGALAEAIDRFEAEIADEVLAASMDAVDEPTGDEVLNADEVDGHALTLAVKRVEN